MVMKGVFNRSMMFLLCMLLGVASAGAEGIRLRVDMPRGQRSIGVGDVFYISYELTDITHAPETPKSVDGAKVMYFERTGQSSRFSSVNGKTSQSFSYTYTLTLRAEKEGTFHYGPVTVGGTKSNSVTYTIGSKQNESRTQTQAAASASPSRGVNDPDAPKFIGKGDGNLYLRASVSKSKAYEQEALVYTVKLYTTYDAIKFIGATAAPKFEGFVVEESQDVSKSLQYETVNGKTYATAVIARYIIFPQMGGLLNVKGNTYTVSVDEREYYHDPFWGKMSVAKPLQLNVTPNDLTVNVLPLPQPQPSDFSGAVGTFSIKSELPKAGFESNQVSSIIYTVTGTGNIKYVKLPELNDLYPKEIEVYSPTADVNVKVGSSNVSGNVRFDYSFMPLETGTFNIPEISFVYFNPSSGRYEKSVAAGYSINVGEGKGSERSQTKSKIAFDDNLKSIGKLRKSHVAYVDRLAYWILCFILPVLLLVIATVYYRRYLKTHSDIAALMSQRAGKMARRRLKKAENCIRRGDSEQFYNEMLTALWGYLGAKLKMPTSELSRDSIRQSLLNANVGEGQADKIIGLIDDCEFAKYSSASSPSDLKDVYESGVSAINGVEESISQKRK